MLVYLDESYRAKDRLFIGALFLPTKAKRRLLHQQFLDLKTKDNFLDNGSPKEIKYAKITTSKSLRVAKGAVSLFSNLDNAFFRACTIPYDPVKMTKLGGNKNVPMKIKEAIIYTRATVQLLKSNLDQTTNAVLLMDELTRASGDKFDALIKGKLGNGDKPIFRHIGYINSASPRNHLVQICDLLLGAILNENYPTKNKLKNRFREFVKLELKLPTLKENYWKNKLKKTADKQHPKYNIRFWKTP